MILDQQTSGQLALMLLTVVMAALERANFKEFGQDQLQNVHVGMQACY